MTTNKNEAKKNPSVLRIREILRERGWTIQFLADQMGVSRSYVSDILSERKSISMNTLLRLSKTLNLPVAMLFTDVQYVIESIQVVCPNCRTQIDCNTDGVKSELMRHPLK